MFSNIGPKSIRALGLWTVLLLAASPTFAATDPFRPDFATFQEQIEANFKSADLPKKLAHSEIKMTFAPLNSFVSGQPSYAFEKLLDNISEAEHRYNVVWKKGKFHFDHDNEKSAYPLERRVRAIRYRGRLFVFDGHHKELTSLYLGAETIPVEILADWSELSRHAFRKKMVESGYAYPLDDRGQLVDHFWKFSEMVDDSNLYLARLIVYKLKMEIRFGAVEILEHSGYKTPVVIKINEDLPFLEFYIAHVLRAAGIVYNPAWGDRLPPKVIAAIREVLLTAKRSQTSLISQALIIQDSDLDPSQLDRDPAAREKIMTIVLTHFLARSRCRQLLGTD